MGAGGSEAVNQQWRTLQQVVGTEGLVRTEVAGRKQVHIGLCVTQASCLRSLPSATSPDC